MKALFGMLVAFGFAAGTVYAAAPQVDQSVQSHAKKKKKKKKKGASNTAPKQYRAAAVKSASGLSGSATQADPLATGVAPAAPATQTTSTTATAAKVTPIKRWSVLYDSWNEFNAEDTNLGHGNLDGWQAVGLSYQLNPTLSLQLIGTFENSFGTTTSNKKVFQTLDPYVAASKTELLGALPGGMTASGYLRFYPGISEGSRNKGQVGFFRGGTDIGGDLTKWFRLAWDTQPRYYIQSYKTFNTLETRDDAGNVLTKSAEVPNIQAVFTHFAAMTFTFSKQWSLYHNTGISYAWYHSDPNSTVAANRDVNHKEFFYGESGLIYAPIPELAVTAGIYSFLSRDLLAQTDDFHFYNKDALYFVDLSGTF